MLPLDVTFMFFLLIKMHSYEKITHNHLASFFNKMCTRVVTMEKAVKGFQMTGIYPLNPHIFDDDDILNSDYRRIIIFLSSLIQKSRNYYR